MKRFAFYGRVSTEDQQDPTSSLNWQLTRSRQLIEPSNGQIVEEFFDIGQSRSLPWKRRPEASRLLESLADPTRGFDSVVIGEPQRAFYGTQYGDTFPLFVHFDVELWVPEIGGAVDPTSDAHDLIMNLYGGMGKGERNRIKTRVRTAMSAQVALDGKYQGGRPPYGYRLADAGPHPNPAKSADGRRLHVLEPHPTYAPVVQRIFADYLCGAGIKAIATELTNQGIPSPSAADPTRNPHRASSRGAWGQSAVRAILKNPRYTGYQVWARQQKHEVLLDIDDVSAGHITKQRWNQTKDWQWSRQPAHQALVSEDNWQAVQDIFTAGTRSSAPKRQRSHDYLLKGMITCNTCGRKLIANSVRGRLQYRCRMKDEYPGIDHPRSLSVREDHLLPAIDQWLGQLFDTNHIDDTISALANADLNDTNSIEELQARQAIKECDKRIANFEIACGSTEDPETIAGLARRIESARSERHGAEIRLRRATTGRGMTPTEIRDVVQNLTNAIALLTHASPEDRRQVYEAARLEILYDHERNRAQLSVAPRVSSGVGGASLTQ
ncbi:MAG: recombinase family protein, partial [Acidimicrobiia bacterium]|nr:recombinase family protein [Acidimicrobiia bacterium]